MALKSSSFSVNISAANKQKSDSAKSKLLSSHSAAVRKVLSDAKQYSHDHKRTQDELNTKRSRKT